MGYVEARNRIFVPSYAHMLALNQDPQDLLEQVYDRARADERQFFFDVDHNPNISNTNSALAHSSVLVNIINEVLGCSANNSRSRYARHL